MFSYNNSKHASSGFLPFFANYRFHPRPLHLSSKSNNEAANLESKEMQEIHQQISNNLTKAISNHKVFANKKQAISDYKVGNYVCLNTKNIRLNLPARKFNPKFLSLFKIINQNKINLFFL